MPRQYTTEFVTAVTVVECVEQTARRLVGCAKAAVWIDSLSKNAGVRMPRSTTRNSALPVSALNLRKTATRVLKGESLVSPEIDYIMRTLGNRATQDELDTMVLRVRSMPWASIVLPE